MKGVPEQCSVLVAYICSGTPFTSLIGLATSRGPTVQTQPCAAFLRRLRRRADTAYLMLAATITGVTGLIVPGAKSLAISNTLSGPIEVLWFGGITLGGFGGIISILVGGRLGLIIERPVRWLLAFLCAAFGTAVGFYVGIQGIAGMAFIGMFGAACLFASWDIRMRLNTPPVEVLLREELAAVRSDFESLKEEFPSGSVSSGP